MENNRNCCGPLKQGILLPMKINFAAFAALLRGAVFRHNAQVREHVMEITRNLVFLGSFGAILLTANGAFADNCVGVYTNVKISSQTLETAPGQKVTYFVDHSSSISNGGNVMIGECGGYVLTVPDGKTSESGLCTRKGKDGDSIIEVISMEPGAERGSWKQIGGTGTLAGKTNSGWFQPTMSDGTTNTGKWGGNCQ
jgi:hypothetical protein